jgi:serine/threonine protein kinase
MTTQQLTAGTVLANSYAIEQLLGAGGMSDVYKAKQFAINKTVAVKIMHPDLVLRDNHLERFRQEALSMSALKHPNIVSVTDFGMTDDGRPFIVMDYIDGVDLSEVIAKEGRLPLARAMPIFLQICDGLAYSHSQGLIHRDLKPRNLILTEYGGVREFVKILDFGIAKATAQTPEQIQELTKTGQILGSPLYMSPEQCTGHQVDHRTDIYSMGCLMYEVICGRLPFRGSTTGETMYKHVHDLPEPLVDAVPNGQQLEAILWKAIAKRPEDRYASMDELKQALVALERQPQLPSSNVRANRVQVEPAKPGLPLHLIVGGIAAVVILGGISFFKTLLSVWALLFIFVGLAFALLFFAARFTPSSDEENVKSFFLVSMNDKPGRFVTTSKRIIFTPAILSQWLGGTAIEIPKNLITSVDSQVDGIIAKLYVAVGEDEYTFAMPSFVLSQVLAHLR